MILQDRSNREKYRISSSHQGRVQGSAEAVKASMERLDVEGIRVNVIRSTAGQITESDIMLASASNAIIYGFNVRPNAMVRKKAEEEGIEIRLHNIIYKALEEMELAMKGMLAPVYEEVIIGQAEVRQTYKVSRIGTIAGCMVTDGCVNVTVRFVSSVRVSSSTRKAWFSASFR